MVKDAEHLHYSDRLEHLGLICLHTRRIRNDLSDTYKIINGIYRGVAGFHFRRGWMASAGARAYNGGLGAVHSSAVPRGQEHEAESYLL